MAWGSKQTQTQLTSITTIQYFATAITVAPTERVHVQIDVNFPASPTDDAVIVVQSTLDDSTENWDDASAHELVLDKDTSDPASISFILEGFYRYRVGVRRSGSTDTLTSADMAYRVGS